MSNYTTNALDAREKAMGRLQTLSLKAAVRGDMGRAMEMARRFSVLRYYGTTGPTVLDSRLAPEPNMADDDLPETDPDDPRTVRA